MLATVVFLYCSFGVGGCGAAGDYDDLTRLQDLPRARAYVKCIQDGAESPSEDMAHMRIRCEREAGISAFGPVGSYTGPWVFISNGKPWHAGAPATSNDHAVSTDESLDGAVMEAARLDGYAPGARVCPNPTVAGAYAIAGVCTGKGGQLYVLHRTGSGWSALRGGMSSSTVEGLERYGVPATIAKQLLDNEARSAGYSSHADEQAYGDAIRAGNKAALSGEMATAIAQWQRAEAVSGPSCNREFIKTNIASAKKVLNLEASGELSTTQAFSAYQKLQMESWTNNPCNRP